MVARQRQTERRWRNSEIEKMVKDEGQRETKKKNKGEKCNYK